MGKKEFKKFKKFNNIEQFKKFYKTMYDIDKKSSFSKYEEENQKKFDKIIAKLLTNKKNSKTKLSNSKYYETEKFFIENTLWNSSFFLLNYLSSNDKIDILSKKFRSVLVNYKPSVKEIWKSGIGSIH